MKSVVSTGGLGVVTLPMVIVPTQASITSDGRTHGRSKTPELTEAGADAFSHNCSSISVDIIYYHDCQLGGCTKELRIY